MTTFNYITRKDKIKELFFKLPKALMYETKYKEISANAKLLYGMLLDRTGLSIENDWFDEEDRAYIICEVSEIEIFLKCARATANKALKELEKINLVKKLRLGQGEANFLYVAHVDTTKETLDTHLNLHKRMVDALKHKRAVAEEKRKAKKLEEKSKIQKFKNCTSTENTSVENNEQLDPLKTLRSTKNELLEVQKMNPNNTDFNKTDISMFVCSENQQTEKKSFLDRYKDFLPPSQYITKTLPLMELKVEYDLFDKVLVDTINNLKVKNKENYLISKLNKLIQKGIYTLDSFVEDTNLYAYKKYQKKNDKELGIDFTDREIKDMCKEEKKVIEDIIMGSVDVSVLVDKSIASVDFFNALTLEYKNMVRDFIIENRLYMPLWIREA